MEVVASRPFPGPAWDELDEVEYLTAPLPRGLGGLRPGVEALAVVSERVDERTLELLPDLRLVANYGVGYDDIDVAACTRRGLAVRRRIVEGDAFGRAGRWGTEWVAGTLLGEEMSGTTLGIVGLGRIGRA